MCVTVSHWNRDCHCSHFSWGNRDTTCLCIGEISSHLELDVFDCLPWKAWNSTCWSFSWWKDRPVKKQQRPIKEWRGQELNGECGQMGHPSSVWTEQAQNQTESRESPTFVNVKRRDNVWEPVWGLASRWRKTRLVQMLHLCSSWTVPGLVPRGISLGLWGAKTEVNMWHLVLVSTGKVVLLVEVGIFKCRLH